MLFKILIMKQIILILTGLFSVGLINAQVSNLPRKTGTTGVNTNTATAVNINKQLDSLRKPNGSVLIHTEKGQHKLYATFTNNKISEYYAITQSGKRLNATYNTSETTCKVCISNPSGSICYEVDCSKIPLPKATVNTRQ